MNKKRGYTRVSAVAAGFNQPLADAAGKGNLSGLRKLVANAATGQLGSAKSKVGRAALIRACKTGFAARDCVRELLVRGAEPDCIDEEHGRTPLIYLSSLTGDPRGRTALGKLLLEIGGDVEAQDTELRRSCLLWAAATGNSPFVRVCLENNANVNVRDVKGMTALTLACSSGHLVCVRQLVEAGAELGAQDYRQGRTPLEWAFANGHADICQLLWLSGNRLGADRIKESIESCLRWRDEEMLGLIIEQLIEESEQNTQARKDRDQVKNEKEEQKCDEIISNRPSLETGGCAMLVYALKCLSEMVCYNSEEQKAQELLEQCRAILIDCDQACASSLDEESGAFSSLLTKLRVRIGHLRAGTRSGPAMYDLFRGNECIVEHRTHTLPLRSFNGYSMMDLQFGSVLALVKAEWCKAIGEQEREVEKNRARSSEELKELLKADTNEYKWDEDDPSDLIAVQEKHQASLNAVLEDPIRIKKFLRAAYGIMQVRLGPSQLRELEALHETCDERITFAHVSMAIWKGHSHLQAAEACSWLVPSFLEKHGDSLEPGRLWPLVEDFIKENAVDLEMWHDLGFLADRHEIFGQLQLALQEKLADTEERMQAYIHAAAKAWRVLQDANTLFMICDNRVTGSVATTKLRALFTSQAPQCDILKPDRYDFLTEAERRTRFVTSWLSCIEAELVQSMLNQAEAEPNAMNWAEFSFIVAQACVSTFIN